MSAREPVRNPVSGALKSPLDPDAGASAPPPSPSTSQLLIEGGTDAVLIEGGPDALLLQA